MMIKKIIIFYIIINLCSSCVSTKPVSSEVDLTFDPNERIEIRNAKNKRKHSAIGISIIGVSTIATGWVGYNSNLTSYKSDDGIKTSKIANATIGALVGFGISYFVNDQILGNKGYNKLETKKDVQKWIRRKYDSGYKVIDYNNNYSNFRIIPKKQENEFVFQSKDDFIDYTKAFYPTNNTVFSLCVNRSLSNLDYESLTWLYKDNRKTLLNSITLKALEDELYNRSIKDGRSKILAYVSKLIPRFRNDLRKRAYDKSGSIRSLAAFSDYFPEWYDKAKTSALNKVRYVKDARDFRSEFKNNDRELITYISEHFNKHQLQEIGNDFEVKCTDIGSGRSVSVDYYIPPGSFAITSLKKAPSSAINIDYSSLNSWEPKRTIITSFNIGYIHSHYAIEQTPTFPNGKYTQIRIENNSPRTLRYCIHPVEDDLQKYFNSAVKSVAAGEAIKYFVGADDAMLLEVGVDVFDALLDNKNVIKRAIISLSKHHLINELGLGVASDIAGSSLVNYLEDIYKNIP